MLLPLLKRYGARATFFWLGEKVEVSKSRLDIQALYEEGHRVALHGYTHVSPWRLSHSAWMRDVEQGLRTLAECLPEAPRYYRPPYGRFRSLRGYRSLRTVLWDLMPPDYRLQKGWAVLAVQRLRAGDIVVLHERKDADWREWESFFERAAQKGLQAKALP